jgi:cell division initiation protein
MLTPKQLKSYSFQAVGRNTYKASDVDAYMDEVYTSYEQMFKENGELVKKMNLLAEKLSEYKDDEDNIRNALLTAERMKEKIVGDARNDALKLINDAQKQTDEQLSGIDKKAGEIIAEAQKKADDIKKSADAAYKEKVGDLEAAADAQERRLRKLKNETREVKKLLIEAYEKQLEQIKDFPDYEYQPEPAPEAKAAPAAAEKPQEDAKPAEADEISDEQETEEIPVEFEDISSTTKSAEKSGNAAAADDNDPDEVPDPDDDDAQPDDFNELKVNIEDMYPKDDKKDDSDITLKDFL